MSVSATPATASCDRASAQPEAREPSDPAACEAFERVLQNRQRQQQPGGGGEEPPSESALLPPAESALLPPALALQLSRAPALPPLSSAGMVDAPATGTRAVIEASLRESPCPLVTPISGGAAEMTWEATVHAPNALPVEVRAVRTEPAALSGSQAAWGLTIATPAAGAEVLVRHAPRLNERLRKHGIEVDHVRVERADDDDR